MREESKLHRVIESNVGSILSALIVSFIVGTLAMIYNSDKTNMIFATQLDYIGQSLGDMKAEMKELKTEMKANTRDRWTRLDHQHYEKRTDTKINKIEDRILRLEDSFQKR